MRTELVKLHHRILLYLLGSEEKIKIKYLHFYFDFVATKFYDRWENKETQRVVIYFWSPQKTIDCTCGCEHVLRMIYSSTFIFQYRIKNLISVFKVSYIFMRSFCIWHNHYDDAPETLREDTDCAICLVAVMTEI